ncbi:MAG: hypothetical protein L6R36_008483 [Xanthoria steineri]|nr:MAG: hypothetical protein L6R36_008483 [Xanthoria steineri]
MADANSAIEAEMKAYIRLANMNSYITPVSFPQEIVETGYPLLMATVREPAKAVQQFPATTPTAKTLHMEKFL